MASSAKKVVISYSTALIGKVALATLASELHKIGALNTQKPPDHGQDNEDCEEEEEEEEDDDDDYDDDYDDDDDDDDDDYDDDDSFAGVL
ncbi:hypothetical protein M0802_010057 [Mischocyttarus mexicanus]|nr:hypothetical protein M0802_010057 [Mischocyttarus mexicanus]